MLRKMAIGLVIGTAAAGASSQPNIQANPDSSAYLQDNRGVIVRSQHGLCWRTGPWTPTDAVPGCDGELVPPIVKPTAPAIVPVPPVVAQAPVPAPVPVMPARCDFAVTLESDQTFAFNKAALSSAARKRIDEEVLPKLASCSKVDAVRIIGHTDRLGSRQYNQKLSENRADAVAAYLKSRGVPAQIETVGAGMTQPIQSCDTKLPRSKQVACLAPNRRVVVEVRGTGK